MVLVLWCYWDFWYIGHSQIFDGKKWYSIKNVQAYQENIRFNNDVFW